jgi:anaerobic ribonucleoside-triphosphate reductase activating protein
MINYHHIEPRSFVDGPGERAVLFFQGCPIHCKGCQNQPLWSTDTNKLSSVHALAETIGALAKPHGQATITGGEPFAQVRELAFLVELLKKGCGVRHIIVYTGYTWEQLNDKMSGVWQPVQAALDYIDVLVDGQFIANQDDPYIAYRGSRNQRPIDVKASRKAGDVVTLDWDSTEIVISQDGCLVMPIGLTPEMAEIGDVKASRRCGETSRYSTME